MQLAGFVGPYDITDVASRSRCLVNLRVYLPNGADQGPLPTPMATTASFPLNDVGGLSLDYPLRAPRSDLLGQPCEVGLEWSPDAGDTWFEPDNARFLYLADGADPLDPADKYSITGKSYVHRLSTAPLLPRNLLNADGKRPFLSVTPGTILKTLLNEAQADGFLTGLAHSSFSTTTDSAGVAWANTLTIYYEPGINYLAVLQNLADQGFVDFKTNGRALYVYNAGTALAVDRTLGTYPVVLRAGRDLTEAPFRRTWENLANHAFFAGADGATYEFLNTVPTMPWGKQGIFISNGSVSDSGTMAALTQNELSQRDGARIEYTRGLDFTRAQSHPFTAYNVGDYIWSAVNGSGVERLRVRQLTLTVSERGQVAGNVVLNDRFIEADLRAARRIEGITNGASSGPGTGGPAPADPGSDTVAPSPPTGLTGSSAAYLGPGGFAQAQVTLSWAAPTTDADGTPLEDFDHYEVFQRLFGTQSADKRMVASTTDTTWNNSPYQTGSNWWFSVRAVDHMGNRSVLTSEIQVGMASDAVPTQAPSTPALTQNLGIVRIYWDGQPVSGSWPADFHYVEVHTSLVNNFTPTTATQSDTLYGEGPSILTGVTYGTPVYAKLIAVDTAGNKSVPSGQATATPARLVGTDINPGAITFEQLAYKDLDNMVSDGSFEDSGQRTVVAGRSHAAWTFTTTSPFHGTNAATINGATSPSTARALNITVAADAQDIQTGAKLFCRFAYKVTAGATGTVRLVVNWVSNTGTLSFNTLDHSVADGTWRQAAAQFTAPANTAKVYVHMLLTSSSTSGTFTVDAVEVRRTVGTALIEDAAITTALIDNLAVNNAKIADLSVGKLTAGTLTSDVLMGARIMTASSGSRLEMSGTGLRMYNGTTLTGHWNSAEGQLRIYNSVDATHTSTGHGIQFGASNAQNLVIDDNEILSRFNGTYGPLYINREGGPVHIGGRIGGFDSNNYGVFPADDDHVVTVRAALRIANVSDADYADEYPPLMIGRPGGAHLFMDSNEIGATAETGDATGTLILCAPRGSAGTDMHFEHILMASNSMAVRRWGSYTGGTRSFIIRGWDSGNDTGLRFSGNSSKLFVTDAQGSANLPIGASSFDVTSAQATKHSIRAVDDALGKVRRAPSTRWKYNNDVEAADKVHVGPMFEDLPDEVRNPGDPDAETAAERSGSVSLSSMVGLLWAAVRELDAKVDGLAVKTK